MSFRFKNFLEDWLAINVKEADNYGSHERAKELAIRLSVCPGTC